MLVFLLNIPYTILGLLLGLISYPNNVKLNKAPFAFVLNVKSFWWKYGYAKNSRACTIGHVILLSKNLEENDLKHELVHVEQHQRMLFIFPILYEIELIRKGYKNNKYEIEAYEKSGSLYKDK